MSVSIAFQYETVVIEKDVLARLLNNLQFSIVARVLKRIRDDSSFFVDNANCKIVFEKPSIPCISVPSNGTK